MTRSILFTKEKKSRQKNDYIKEKRPMKYFNFKFFTAEKNENNNIIWLYGKKKKIL